MTRMTGPDCVVMCNLINTYIHTYIEPTYIHRAYIHTYIYILKIVATEAKRSQIEDAVGSSWAALAAEEDPQGRGIGTLLVEAGAGGGGGGGGGGGEGEGRGGEGGAGVLDSENNGRIRWQFSLIGRLS